MSKKHKRSKRSKRKQKGKRERVFMVTRTLGPNASEALSELDIQAEDLETYMFSHYLLPPEMQSCEYGTMPSLALLEAALSALEADIEDSRELLGAIAVLGHTPSERAIEALRRYAKSSRPFAGVACAALAECIDMIGMCRQPDSFLAS